MIGIIEEKISAYTIAEKIHNHFPTINIYLYPTEKMEEGINRLIERKCQIIIIPNNKIKFWKEKYPNIIFLALDATNQNNSYILEQKELIKAIDTGNLQEIKNILNKLHIKEDTILLKNPKLLWIKSILEEEFQDKKILEITDVLIEKIKQHKKLLQESSSATIQMIIN